MNRHNDIKQEISLALKHLGADPSLVTTIGSWRNGLTDEDVLGMLQIWNASQGAQMMRARPFTCPYCAEMTAVRTTNQFVFALEAFCGHCGQKFKINHDKPEK